MSGTGLAQHNSAVGWEKKTFRPATSDNSWSLLQTRGELYLDHTCDAEVSQDSG